MLLSLNLHSGGRPSNASDKVVDFDLVDGDLWVILALCPPFPALIFSEALSGPLIFQSLMLSSNHACFRIGPKT